MTSNLAIDSQASSSSSSDHVVSLASGAADPSPRLGNSELLLQMLPGLGQTLPDSGRIDVKSPGDLGGAEAVDGPGHDLTLFRRQVGQRRQHPASFVVHFETLAADSGSGRSGTPSTEVSWVIRYR